MTTEDELRKLLHTRADATTWKLTVDDVVNNDFIADVVPIDRGRRRTSVVLSAVAAVGALVAGGAYVAAHGGSTTRVKVGAATRRTSADDTSVSTQGPQGASNISLSGMTLLLPKTPPPNFRVQNASVMPPGASNGGPPGFISYTRALQGATADDAIIISASGSIGGNSFGTKPPDPAATATKVHGVDAELTTSAQHKQLTWTENGLMYFVGAMGSITETDLVALANSIGSPPPKSAVFTLPVPANYTVTFDGDPNTQQTWNYNVSYSRENLDRQQDDNLNYSVTPGVKGLPSGLTFGAGPEGQTKKLTIGGVSATLSRFDPMANAPAEVRGSAPTQTEVVSILWQRADGLQVSVNGQGLTDDEAITFAESLHEVDEATFKATFGDRLIGPGGPGGPAFTPDFSGPGVVTFTGTLEGKTWTIRIAPASDTSMGRCTEFTLEGGGVGTSCGGPGADADAPLHFEGWSSDGTKSVVNAVVPAGVVALVVRDADTGRELVRIDTVGTTGDDRRAYAAIVKPLPSDVKQFVLVGLDANGKETGKPAEAMPAGAYPGNQQSGPYGPDATGPGSPADLRSKPVLVSGTLDGRAWELRDMPSGLGGPTTVSCWTITFAVSDPSPVCQNEPTTGTIDVAITQNRRMFVVVSVKPEVAKIEVTRKSGTTTEIPVQAGSARLVVIPLGLDDVLTSVKSLDASGKKLDQVDGTLPGDPNVPGNFGSYGGSGYPTTASVSYSGATTAVPATTVPN
jgi:hypothetical protein